MNRFPDPCTGYRQSLCLLASDLMTQDERESLESHVAGCAACRKYFEEIQALTVPLANWEDAMLNLAPRQEAQTKWDAEFAKAIEPNQPMPIAFLIWLLDWCKDMILPHRRAWTALAASWLVLLAINLSQRGPALTQAKKSPPPSPELVRAYLQHEGFVFKWSEPATKREVVRPRPPTVAPRSDRRRVLFLG